VIFVYALLVQEKSASIQEGNPDPAGSRRRVPVIVITFANMTLFGFIGSMKGVSFPLIKNSFNASYENMGLMNALIYLTAVCACITAGIFMNRFGLKKAIAASFAFIILGAGSLYFASMFWMTVGLYLILQSGFCFFEISLNGVGVRVFTVKSGLMMNLLHFFFGLGAIGGPRFMGFMVHRMGMKWQEVYPLVLIPAFILLIISLMIRFPGKVETADTQDKPTFWTALKDPMVWFLGFILGIACGLENCSVAWSGLYLQDVYGLSPTTTGAAFVSMFYLLFTISRFSSGFIIEKTGYMKSIFASAIIIFIFFVAAFSLGIKGIYLLPVTGFFIAIMWPTIIAINVGVFKERAQAATSAIICITFTLNGIIQYGVGLSNRFLGAAWGYRSFILLCSIILVGLLFLLVRRNKARGWNIR